MGSGTVEIDYSITQRGSDFLLTPDFLGVFFQLTMIYGLLYFFVTGRSRGLYWMGIGFGLGMLSQYTTLLFAAWLAVGLLGFDALAEETPRPEAAPPEAVTPPPTPGNLVYVPKKDLAKNTLTTNLLNLLIRTYSLEYERVVAEYVFDSDADVTHAGVA